MAGVCLLAAATNFFFYKQLLFATFDPEVAPIYGVPASRTETIMALVLAATVIASMQVMGVTLIAAAIVTPAIVARLLTDSFSTMLWLAALIGAVCGVAGVYLSYFLDIASGATVVLVSTTLFALVMGASALRRRFGHQQARRSARSGRAQSIAGLLD
jgi:manganese/iron transport system permease protein/iron/zinc/copper transport system permease protein